MPEPSVAGLDENCGLLVIGAGPAGLAAAATGAGHGLRTIVLDERLGYDDPRDREPELVAKDLANDYVTPVAARQYYGYEDGQ